MIDRYVDALKAVADSNRLRLFWLLVHVNQKVSVAEAVDVLQESQYNVSRNLKMLQRAKLVTPKKEGKWVFYTLNDGEDKFHRAILDAVRSIDSDQFDQEIALCKARLDMRQNGRCVVGANSDEWQARTRTLHSE